MSVRLLVLLSSVFALSLFVACSGREANSGAESPDNMGGHAAGGGDGDAVNPPPGPGASPEDSEFTLLFRDDFDTFDSARWRLMTHSWAGNLAVFSAESAKIEDGFLNLTLLEAPEGTMSDGGAKSFLGAEVRSVDTLTYGRVRARARFARGSSVVSSLVTIYTPWPADNWNELDIEVLGKDPTHPQFNAMVYTGTLPAPTTPVSPTQHPQLVDLGFDVSADFHDYMIEWTPDGAWFWVDDVLRHTWTEKIDLMNLPQNILLTIWASGSPGWAGPVTEATVGAKATYDFIELYKYTP